MCLCAIRLETPGPCLSCIRIFQKTMADDQSLGSIFSGLPAGDLTHQNLDWVLNRTSLCKIRSRHSWEVLEWCLKKSHDSYSLPRFIFKDFGNRRVFKNFECRLHIIWSKRVLLLCLPMVPSLLKQLKGLNFSDKMFSSSQSYTPVKGWMLLLSWNWASSCLFFPETLTVPFKHRADEGGPPQHSDSWHSLWGDLGHQCSHSERLALPELQQSTLCICKSWARALCQDL